MKRGRFGPVEVETMLADDLDEVLGVELRCLRGAWSRAHFLAEIESPASTCLVARDSGREATPVVGFAVARLVVDELEVLAVAVEPAARRHGIASALLGRVVEETKPHGARFAHLEVRANNLAAISLYAGFGFESVGVRPRYYVDPVEDAILMRADLNASPVSP